MAGIESTFVSKHKNCCHSGGAKGADKLFGELATSVGHDVRHYGFEGHHSPCPREQIITLNALALGVADGHLRKANYSIGRKFPTRSEYVNNLLRRNYYQVCNSTSIFASCAFDRDMKPEGGTAWALVMGINMYVPNIHVFDWSRDVWLRYNYGQHTLGARWEEVERESVPMPEGHYAGIGSSELPDNGAREIIWLYRR